jgi:adenine-specific DNA-methyltransferase
MNYIGSKRRVSSFIKESVLSVVGEDLSQKIFCDMFAGTGVVGRIFKQDVKKVIANDLEYYSYVLNKNYIQNHQKLDYHDKLEKLAKLTPKKGFIYQHYCRGGGGERQYFSDANGQKIDAIRSEIERWKGTGEIDDGVYFFLLATLLESADKVANTASVYGAYLKHLKKTAQQDLVLEPATYTLNDNSHEVYNDDANTLIERIQGDILYLDPPYNEREYGANYHLLNTIAKYEPFTPKGVTGLPEYNRSAYTKRTKVRESFEALIQKANFRYIFVSYNNEGMMKEAEIKAIMMKYGKYSLKTMPYKRFLADKAGRRNVKDVETFEHLHVLEKR